MILAYLYFILPGAVANMLPPLVKKINFLNYPLDANKTWHNKRLLGPNKTGRGLLFGTLGAILTIQIQPYFLKSIHLINYDQYNLILLGTAIGLGVLGGDALGSFLKRRRNIAPGKPAPVLDQTDALVGALLLLWPFKILTTTMIITLLIIVPLTHIIIRLIGYKLKLVQEKW